MTNESDVRTTELRTEYLFLSCLFQFSHKTRQTMLLYAYFTPKVDFKRKFNHHQSFLYEWRLTARTIRKFRIGESIWIESRIGRTIRNRIESHEASQVPTYKLLRWVKFQWTLLDIYVCHQLLIYCSLSLSLSLPLPSLCAELRRQFLLYLDADVFVLCSKQLTFGHPSYSEKGRGDHWSGIAN